MKMANEKEKWVEYATQITNAIIEMFDEDNDNFIDQNELLQDDNLTHFFHALANASPTMIYSRITGDDKNNLEFNHLANQLCFQFSKIVDKSESDK